VAFNYVAFNYVIFTLRDS